MECHTWQADWCPSVRNALLKQQDNLLLTTVLLGLSQSQKCAHSIQYHTRVTPKKFQPSPKVSEQGLMQCICNILSASLKDQQHSLNCQSAKAIYQWALDQQLRDSISVVCKHTGSIRMDKCVDVRRGWLCWANRCTWDGREVYRMN